MPPAHRPIVDRFWSRVDKAHGRGCWLWLGHLTFGYGYIGAGGRNGKTNRAHRVSWELHHGPIPEGLLVLHRCDNRRCVNPDHLFLGTQADNVADMIAKGRDAAPGLRARHGQSPGRAKLNPIQVREIRRTYCRGSDTHGSYALAALYGVAQGTIYRIVSGRGWRRER